jgi:hypothetical protein
VVRVHALEGRLQYTRGAFVTGRALLQAVEFKAELGDRQTAEVLELEVDPRCYRGQEEISRNPWPQCWRADTWRR